MGRPSEASLPNASSSERSDERESDRSLPSTSAVCSVQEDEGSVPREKRPSAKAHGGEIETKSET